VEESPLLERLSEVATEHFSLVGVVEGGKAEFVIWSEEVDEPVPVVIRSWVQRLLEKAGLRAVSASPEGSYLVFEV